MLNTLTTTCWFCKPCYDKRQNRSVIVSLSNTVEKLSKKLEIFEETVKSVDKIPTLPNVLPQSKLSEDDSFKYRLKIIGVKESSKRFQDARQWEDKEAIETIVNKLDVPNAVLKDCYRLGKFANDKTRPIIATFSSVWDARLIRTKAIQNNLYKSDSVLVLADLSPGDRDIEKKILAKRHELIQNGIVKSRMKIRNLKLFVDNEEVKMN